MDTFLELFSNHIKGPDFPTGGLLFGIDGIKSAYSTGRGRVMIQANHKVEFMNKQEDRIRLVFDELPYQVNKANLVMRIAELMKLKKVEGICNQYSETCLKELNNFPESDYKKGLIDIVENINARVS